MRILQILGKTVLIVLLAILILLVLTLVVLLINSPGELPALRDEQGNPIAGAISEKVVVEIGGVRQGMFLRGEDATKPVLLFLHGGPASPELAMMLAEETGERLEQEFVVCYWDQRGAGMSYSGSLDPATVNTEQLVEDAAEVTGYLRARFGQEKIYLMGHSWGSYLGIRTILKYPDLYRAYLGVGQVTDQIRSQQLAYVHMQELAQAAGDARSLEKLAVFDPEGPDYNLLLEQYGIGNFRNGPTMPGMLKNLLLFHGYTLSEKIGCFRGMSLSHRQLNSFVHDNLFESAARLAVPVYFLHGEYDYMVSHELAAQYCRAVQAPDKKFYTFQSSAHSPIWEEPGAFMGAVREILGRDTCEKAGVVGHSP